jgi:predicted membrane chloride channel (bestrophin family)
MEIPKTIKKKSNKIWQKWSIAFRITPLILFVALLKFLSHHFELEVLELNALFTSLIAGTIFLIGFLISGVLSDYKESEKLPSELSAAIKSLYDDAYTIYKSKNSQNAFQFITFQKAFAHSLMDWFYKRETTAVMLDKISQMNDFIFELDNEGIQPGYLIKIKNEQNNIRKMVLRIDTIRETNFIGSAYAILEAMGFLIAFSLIIIKIEPFYVALFFTLLVTFLISYMFLLIKDLDNPFDYAENGESGTEISLKPIHDLIKVFQKL